MNANLAHSSHRHRTTRTVTMVVALVAALGLLAAPSAASAADPTDASAPPSAAPRPQVGAEMDNDQPRESREARVQRYGELAFAVDASVAPRDSVADAIDRESGPRQIAAMVSSEGARSEFVRDEVMVHTTSRSELDSFLTKWSGVLLASDEPDRTGQFHHVRVDVSTADVAALPTNLLSFEREHVGTYRVSDENALGLLALAAAETASGRQTFPAWVDEGAGIVDGEVFEESEFYVNIDTKEVTNTRSVFTWAAFRTGDPPDTGVAAAWQLLEAKGKLGASPRLMINDGGFRHNGDYPADATLRDADWGSVNPSTCTNGTRCDWHGTNVTMAAMAEVDNKYGIAGPAGPLAAELVAVAKSRTDILSSLRRVRDRVLEHRPDFVNMSWSAKVTAFKYGTLSAVDKHLAKIRSAGALPFVAAGNDGENVDQSALIVPCESALAVCVGGLSSGSNLVAPNSNFGTDEAPHSVEIYAPYCLPMIDPLFPDEPLRTGCGTSYSSPFVMGVAALVKAARPSLDLNGIKQMLIDTAHRGGSGWFSYGNDHRVDAFSAVATALEMATPPPTVKITHPVKNGEYGLEHWFNFTASVTDYRGYPLKVQWSSSRDGNLGPPTMGVHGYGKLSPGTHQIRAQVLDFNDQYGGDAFWITVKDLDASAVILTPPKGKSYTAGRSIVLTAYTFDPDLDGPVPGNDVKWKVTRGGATLHTGSGHNSIIDGGLSAGTATVTLTAGGATTSRTIKVVNPTVGDAAPSSVTIISPEWKKYTTSGEPVTFHFEGEATDAKDGSIAGTRMRWTAYGVNTSKVLCSGSAVPGQGGLNKEKANITKDCASFDAALGMQDGVLGDNPWTVMLEAFDSAGNVTSKVSLVTLHAQVT